MSGIEVRPATLRDAKAIANIHVNVWRQAYAEILPAEQLKNLSVEKRQAMWREAIEYYEPQVQVALVGGEIVGFVGFDRSRDPKSKATTGEIWAMYVDQSHWDKGVGLALWDAAREGLLEEGCNTVTLWVMLQNERAIRFYTLAGFKRELNTAKTVEMGGIKVEEIRMARTLA